MPREGANRARQIVMALQWDRGRWTWLLLITASLDAVTGLGDTLEPLLRYDRAAIAAGGWWRLLTAHLVHLDLHHLLLNELGLVLVWSLFADAFDGLQWAIIVFASALAISCGLWWVSPHVAWYVGASGVLHSVMAAGVIRHWTLRSWDRWLLTVCLGAKLAYEQYAGPPTPWVVVDAHLYGALSGLIVGAALSRRTAIIRHRFSA